MTLVSTAARASSSSGSGAITQLFSLVLAAPGTFSQAAIPQTANDLYIVGKLRTAAVATIAAGAITLNADGTANYDQELFSAFAATASAAETFGANEISLGNIPGASAAAGMFANVEILIPGYASTTWQKTVSVRTMTRAGAATTNVLATVLAGHWRNTAAVTQVTIAGSGGANLATGSTLRIYGLT